MVSAPRDAVGHLGVVCNVSTVVVARWCEPGPVRLSRLRGIRPHEAFTVWERLALVAGVVGTGVDGAWGRVRVHSPLRRWIVDFAAFEVAAALWWRIEVVIARHRVDRE